MNLLRRIVTFAFAAFLIFESFSALRSDSVELYSRNSNGRIVARAQEPKAFWGFTGGYIVIAAICLYYAFRKGGGDED